jgi:nucleoside-diphosphate-sugar epimerase
MSSTNSRVLVTGVNGFIGAQVANAFLEAGYTVIGTSRKPAKAQKLKDFFRKYGEDKFEVAEVADLEDEGAFDDLVKRNYRLNIRGKWRISHDITFISLQTLM